MLLKYWNYIISKPTKCLSDAALNTNEDTSQSVIIFPDASNTFDLSACNTSDIKAATDA